MAIRILSRGNTHIQFDDANYTIEDSVGDKSTGYYTLKTAPGGNLVARLYETDIYWHQPPSAVNWVAIGTHLKITLP